MSITDESPADSGVDSSHISPVATKLSSNDERFKQRIMAFGKAVLYRNVSGMNDFRNYMRSITRQLSFKSVWLDDEALKRMEIEFEDSMAKYLYTQMYYQYFFESNLAEPDTCIWALTNMSDLFTSFNDSCFHADIAASWLWSIIDEFVSVVEAILRFKSMSQLFDNIAKIAKPLILLNPLNELVVSSKVINMIEAKKYSNDNKDSAFLRALGYYSVVGLIRFHTFDGDYAQALNYIDRISLDINDQKMYSGSVIQCILATNYYAAFCFLMSRRYMDCVNILCDTLQFVFDTKEIELKVSRIKSIPYYVRKMCNTLALVLTLYPIQIGDQIITEMKSIVGNRFHRLHEGDLAVFSEVFLDAAPSCPYNMGEDEIAQRTKTRELKAFMAEIEEQRAFIRLRSILENYSSISIDKLASCIHKSETDTLSYLMSWKHKLAIPHGKTANMMRSHSTVDFFIDRDMVYVSHIKPADKYSSIMVEQKLSLAKLQSERCKKIRA